MSCEGHVDTDDDLRLARRLKRDTVDRGRSYLMITRYTTLVKPMFDTFVSPSKSTPTSSFPGAGTNTVAIDLIVQHIRTSSTKRFDEFMATW